MGCRTSLPVNGIWDQCTELRMTVNRDLKTTIDKITKVMETKDNKAIKNLAARAC